MKQRSVTCLCLLNLVCATTFFLASNAAQGCGDINVEIVSPDDDAGIRGPEQIVNLHIWTTGGLQINSCAVYYNEELKWSHVFPQPKPTNTYYQDSFCTFEMDNNTDGKLKAKAWSYGSLVLLATDEQTNPVDNAYLISVTRGTCSNPGTVIWKYWSGDGWTPISNWCTSEHEDTPCVGWDASTEGGAYPPGYCTGACGHGSPHTVCQYGDTPGYTGSGRNCPRVTGVTDYIGCDDEFGWAKIHLLSPVTAICGCQRTWIRIHGDGGDYCSARQKLYKTHGCVRMRNEKVQALCDIVETASGRVGGYAGNICISVPNP